jgi:hypothetical protein
LPNRSFKGPQDWPSDGRLDTRRRSCTYLERYHHPRRYVPSILVCYAIIHAVLTTPFTDEGDELVNVNLMDTEKTRENIENRKKKPVYQGYDDDEFETGERGILAQYDEDKKIKVGEWLVL